MPRRLLLIAAAALAATAGSAAIAGEYSRYSDDPANPHDPPIANTDARIVAWAHAVVDYSPAPGVGVDFRDPVVGIGSLGDLYDPADPPPVGEIPPFSGVTEPFGGDVTDTSDEYGFIGYDLAGSITVGFARAIHNGDGPDFAVFENGSDFGTGLIAELAYVEVSTDGANFARFDAISRSTEYLNDDWGSSYASIDETNVYNLAGKHLDGWGTPFDLGELQDHPNVTSGSVDLSEINFVRLVNIPGNADYLDAEANGILDAWITVDSGGFDFRLSEGVGVINAVPEPHTIVLLIAGILTLLISGRSWT